MMHARGCSNLQGVVDLAAVQLVRASAVGAKLTQRSHAPDYLSAIGRIGMVCGRCGELGSWRNEKIASGSVRIHQRQYARSTAR